MARRTVLQFDHAVFRADPTTCQSGTVEVRFADTDIKNVAVQCSCRSINES